MGVFAPNKRSSTVKKYFALALRFLAYLYRTTQGAHHHFDVEDGTYAPEDGTYAPEDVVHLIAGQQRAW